MESFMHKFFLWRLFDNILPCITNLVKRKLPISSCCPCCEKVDETVIDDFLNVLKPTKQETLIVY